MAQVTLPAMREAAIQVWAVWFPRLLTTLLHCSCFSQSRFHMQFQQPTDRHHYKSIRCEPDAARLSHTASGGAEGLTTLIDLLAGSLNVSMCVTSSDPGIEVKCRRKGHSNAWEERDTEQKSSALECTCVRLGGLPGHWGGAPCRQ